MSPPPGIHGSEKPWPDARPLGWLRRVAAFLATPLLLGQLTAVLQAASPERSLEVTMLEQLMTMVFSGVTTAVVAVVLRGRPAAGWAHAGVGAAAGLVLSAWLRLGNSGWRPLHWVDLILPLIGGLLGGLFWLLARAPVGEWIRRLKS